MTKTWKLTFVSLLMTASVCQAAPHSASETVYSDDYHDSTHLPEYCGRVRQLVYQKEQDQVVKSVVTVSSEGETVQFDNADLSVVLAKDFMEAAERSSQALYQPTVLARFGGFLRRALVVICFQSVRIRETLNHNGVVIKAGYLDKESTAVHTIYL
ncbi:MAG: hypothetical protein AAF202_10600 [Pseudomonadota bacterium]